MKKIVRTMLAAVFAAAFASGATPQEPARANTDWFQKAGYGVFVHYLAGLQNSAGAIHSLGRETSWDECVRDFDTERFADTMAECGAGYVIFTTMQISRFMIAPNSTFDRISGYKPGEACATRDLIEDLYQSLHKRNIVLMLYYTGDGPRGDEKAGPAFNCQNPVPRDFVEKWASVAAEYGERYGEKVAGYWVDGCYPFIGYDEEKLGILAKGLKAGNPNRIIALNRGVDPSVMSYTVHEDYTCGEQNKFHEIPAQRFLNGEQWHILSYLSPNWWAAPGAGYTKEEIADYVRSVNERGGVVSIDVLLYRDGAMDRSQVELLKAVKAAARDPKPRPAIPPGNLACRKPARLLSLDGARELPVNGDTHFARLGVDGKPATFAQAAGEYAWTYEVDLIDTAALRRVKVTFDQGYPTVYEIRVSSDGKEWATVADGKGHDGAPLDVTFESRSARYVRVCAVKPDGPNQPGSQMAVAELEAYE